MCQYIINGGKKLAGEIEIEGSKNAVLPILAATLINSGVSVIHNCPKLRDVKLMIDIIEELGCKVSRERETVIIDSSCMSGFTISKDIANEMRSSIIFLGAVLSGMKEIFIPRPGGCDIGARPVNLHKMAMEMMGAEIHDVENEFIHAKAEALCGCKINLDYPSVGATENIMIAAVCANGETIIKNAAKEPEIIDLQNFLNAMGAQITGAGNDIIYISGKRREELHDVEYTVIPDRIVAGTYMAAAAVTGGDLILKNIIPQHVLPVISILEDSGCKITAFDDTIRIKGPVSLKSPGAIKTLPHPGFPTDMQAQMISVMSVAKGKSIMEETVFECRFKHVEELIRMGADIKIKGQTAFINGVSRLSGADIEAKDLRGGAALIIAGLNADGCTIVNDTKYIERGYVDIEKKLANVGAKIIKNGEWRIEI